MTVLMREEDCTLSISWKASLIARPPHVPRKVVDIVGTGTLKRRGGGGGGGGGGVNDRPACRITVG